MRAHDKNAGPAAGRPVGSPASGPPIQPTSDPTSAPIQTPDVHDTQTSDRPTETADTFLDPEPREARPPRTIGTWGHLQLIEEIGRGAFGCVYRAWDEVLAREVALKVIPLAHPDVRIADSVLREGRLLARIRHPNVVTVHGAQQLGDEIGLWMELVRGRPLGQIVRREGPLGPEEVTVVAVSLCHALSAVHGAGLVHRDLSAHNVMREAGGRIVLMDFGTGRETAATPGERRDLAGTPPYMAPEVLSGRAASPASDIYSLGVLMFFLVSGRYPFEGRTMTAVARAQSLGERRLLADVRPGLPDSFVRIVDRALAPVPEGRYTTAGAMIGDLVEAIPAGPGRRVPTAPLALESDGLVERTPSARPSSQESQVGAIAGGSVWPIPTLVLTGLSVVASIWILGFLMSAAFDLTLSREAGFANDSALDWGMWGLRSLVAPLVYAILAVLAFRSAVVGWRLVEGLVPPLRVVRQRQARTLAAVPARVGLIDRAAFGKAVLALQILALVLVWLAYADLLEALKGPISVADAASLEPLRPEYSTVHVRYRVVLTMLLVGMGAAWYSLLRPGASEGRPVERATLVGGALVIALVVLMLELPYRLIWHNRFQRAEFAGERCYVLGQRNAELLLHCPGSRPPRNRIVRSDDPRVERRDVIESLFANDPNVR
jgi:serine/threonine protein kinase